MPPSSRMPPPSRMPASRTIARQTCEWGGFAPEHASYSKRPRRLARLADPARPAPSPRRMRQGERHARKSESSCSSRLSLHRSTSGGRSSCSRSSRSSCSAEAGHHRATLHRPCIDCPPLCAGDAPLRTVAAAGCAASGRRRSPRPSGDRVEDESGRRSASPAACHACGCPSELRTRTCPSPSRRGCRGRRAPERGRCVPDGPLPRCACRCPTGRA